MLTIWDSFSDKIHTVAHLLPSSAILFTTVAGLPNVGTILSWYYFQTVPYVTLFEECQRVPCNLGIYINNQSRILTSGEEKSNYIFFFNCSLFSPERFLASIFSTASRITTFKKFSPFSVVSEKCSSVFLKIYVKNPYYNSPVKIWTKL